MDFPCPFLFCLILFLLLLCYFLFVPFFQFVMSSLMRVLSVL